MITYTKPHLSGENNGRWKGGRNIRKDGYIEVYAPTHPLASKNGYVLEHRLVLESHLGRLLNKGEVVHHLNHNPSDNRLENLKLLENQSLHYLIHQKGRIRNDISKEKIIELKLTLSERKIAVLLSTSRKLIRKRLKEGNPWERLPK